MLDEAETRLSAAKKGGNSRAIGEAYLDVAFALYQRSPEWQAFQEDSPQALTQINQAIETFTSIPFPDGIARAHLARAAIFTNLAEGEENGQRKVEDVEQALDACLAAQEALEVEGVHTGEVFDIYSSISVLLLQLRELSDKKEYQKQFEDLIAANSRVLGEIVSVDLELRNEGESMLVTAQLLGALAAIEEEEEERAEILTAQSLVALQAATWLETTSDPDLLDQAWEEFQQASAKLEGSAESVPETQNEPGKCPDCGNPNPAAAKFCSECGAQLQGGK
ncbi:MAG: zinc ribbon domain-containing protein [Anaerolineales bacterium]